MSQELESREKYNSAIIALGSNLGHEELLSDKLLCAATAEIGAAIGNVAAASRLYRTPAYPIGSGPDFVNSCILVQTRLAAPDVLAALHRIEARFGRQRNKRWAARTVDLDLIAMGDTIEPDRETLQRWINLPQDRQKVEAPDTLILPHPRLQDRAFVLIPLADIAPDWRHPLTGRSVAAMVAALPEADKASVLPL